MVSLAAEQRLEERGERVDERIVDGTLSRGVANRKKNVPKALLKPATWAKVPKEGARDHLRIVVIDPAAPSSQYEAIALAMSR